MTIKSIVTLWMWENSIVKGRCKRGGKKKKRGFPLSQFRFKTNKESGKWIFPLPIFLPLPRIQTRP